MNLFPVQFEHRKWGYVDSTGEVVIHGVYDDAGFFREGLAYVKQGSRLLVLDSVLRPQGSIVNASSTGSFSEGRLVFERHDRSGLIDRFAKVRLEPIYDRLFPVTNGLSVASLQEAYGVCDTQGNWAVEPKYWSISVFERGSDRTSAVLKTGEVVIITDKGGVLKTPELSKAGRFREDLIPVQLKSSGEFGWLDGSCSVVRSFPWMEGIGEAFYDGTIPVKVDGQWAVADSSGNLLTEPKFMQLGNLHGERRWFQDSATRLWGYLDSACNLIIEPVFRSVRNFSDGLAYVSTGERPNKRYFLVNSKVAIVWPKIK